MGASFLGNFHSRFLPLGQASKILQTVNSTEGLVDTVVPQTTGRRSAGSVSRGSTWAVHLVSCQSVPQAPLTVLEDLFNRRLLAL